MSASDIDEVARVLREVALAVVRETPPHQLSRTAASTLSGLQRHGPQRITALAEQEVVSQPSMTALVQRLEGLDYVSRTADPADGRASLVAITDAGVHVVSLRRAKHERAIRERLVRLASTDLASLAASLPALTHFTDTTESSPTHDLDVPDVPELLA